MFYWYVWRFDVMNTAENFLGTKQSLNAWSIARGCTVWQSSRREAAGTIAEEAFSSSPSCPPVVASAPSGSAASGPLPASELEQKHAFLLGTGTGPHRSALKITDLTSAPASTTLVAAVATRGLLAASRAGNPAVAVARSIGGGSRKGRGERGNAWRVRTCWICMISLSSSGGLA